MTRADNPGRSGRAAAWWRAIAICSCSARPAPASSPSLLRIVLTSGARSGPSTRWERIRGEATYTYQLRAFAGAVLRGEPVVTTPEDAVANMRQIDDVYRAAGLPLRGTR